MLRLGLVLLVCSLSAVFETTVGAHAAAINRCERHSCCGAKAYNPAAATCCEEGHGPNVTADVTKGLSEMVSACCGLTAYNPLNEICCNSTVLTKPVAFAQCCGSVAYDAHNQLCCGPLDNRRVLERESRDHQCCGHEQFNTTSQCCCMNVSLEIHEKDHECCKKESGVCGNKTYNEHAELCCQLTVVKKKTPNAQCCGTVAYDADNQLCCGPLDNRKVLKRESSDHQCCGHEQFNTTSQCCCLKNGSLDIHPKHHKCCVEESGVCGNKTYNEHAELCCQLTVVTKPPPNAQCCAKVAYDAHNQLCCGPLDNRTVLDRESRHHQCCGHEQFNTKTHCCCVTHGFLDIHPKHHKCCLEESGVQPLTPGSQPTCTQASSVSNLTDLEPSIRASSCYNPKKFRCCEKKQSNRCCTTGQCDAAVYNPKTDVCCDGHVKKLLQDQHNGSSGHCCGTEVYQPLDEICCDGHRHKKREREEKNMHCCGAQAYNIEDAHMKCCAGTLYNLTLPRQEVRCCGSILQKKKDVCCSHEDKMVPWSAKVGFKCCGHLYYNTSLWDCCTGKLSPVHQPRLNKTKTIEEERLQSLNNLSEQELCGELNVTIVESVSPCSTVISSTLKVHGTTQSVEVLPSPQILYTSDHCNSPTLIPGKTYFFIGSTFFTDPNHDSILQSIHFIFYKCNRSFTAG
ncbi:uncharacterized protein LOC115595639 [Sparus aurata]|uniref:uncharacterized protein LOC115595639 n=1 Tax=Sparus aurata TaxID=8175 RepID=UPI0011C1BFDD|nr:uncharacterized protein LOC115595639 [Sparus aurata]